MLLVLSIIVRISIATKNNNAEITEYHMLSSLISSNDGLVTLLFKKTTGFRNKFF